MSRANRHDSVEFKDKKKYGDRVTCVVSTTLFTISFVMAYAIYKHVYAEMLIYVVGHNAFQIMFSVLKIEERNETKKKTIRYSTSLT